MKIGPKTDASNYPEFELENLENYARNWAKYLNEKYKVIEIKFIYLCRLNIKIQKQLKSRWRKQWTTTKYAVIFEYTGCIGYDVRSVESYPIEGYGDCHNFISAIKFAGHYAGDHPFFDDAFKRRVYRKELSVDVFREWKFIPKRAKGKLKDVLIDGKTPWIDLDTAVELYRADLLCADPLPDAILRIIKRAKPEIKSIYDAIKKTEGSLSNADSKKLQKAALDAFDSDNQSYKIVKRPHLLQNDLYSLTPGQEKRAFVGRLLKSVVESEKLKQPPANKLWAAYREISTKTKS